MSSRKQMRVAMDEYPVWVREQGPADSKTPLTTPLTIPHNIS